MISLFSWFPIVPKGTLPRGEPFGPGLQKFELSVVQDYNVVYSKIDE